MVLVDQGAVDEDVHACAIDVDCHDYGKSGWVSSPVATLVTSDFKTREPEAYELMTKLSFTTDEMNELLAWKEENNATGEETAVYFLTNYQDQWSEWLNDEAKENLSALLE